LRWANYAKKVGLFVAPLATAAARATLVPFGLRLIAHGPGVTITGGAFA